jgi:hypothetical protein
LTLQCHIFLFITLRVVLFWFVRVHIAFMLVLSCSFTVTLFHSAHAVPYSFQSTSWGPWNKRGYFYWYKNAFPTKLDFNLLFGMFQSENKIFRTKRPVNFLPSVHYTVCTKIVSLPTSQLVLWHKESVVQVLCNLLLIVKFTNSVYIKV